MVYDDYRADLLQRRARINFPPDCVNEEPLLLRSSPFFWTMTWMLRFADDHYIRIWEHFVKVARVQDSSRHAFSFHYGPVDRPENVRGEYRVGAPVTIRIDLPPTGDPVHLHYLGPEPHYTQDRVVGLQLRDIEKFAWLEAVLLHRRRGMPLDQILKFNVR